MDVHRDQETKLGVKRQCFTDSVHELWKLFHREIWLVEDQVNVAYENAHQRRSRRNRENLFLVRQVFKFIFTPYQRYELTNSSTLAGVGFVNSSLPALRVELLQPFPSVA